MPLPESFRAGPFTTAQAVAAGVGRGVIDGPSVRTLLPGVHVAAGCPVTVPMMVAGARMVLPVDALVTGPSALRLMGATVGPLRPLHFVSRHPHQVRRRGVRVVRVQTLPSAVAGIVLPVEAFLASARLLDLVELVTAGDHLVRTGRCRPEQLRAAAEGWSGRGSMAARRAASLVRERVDSPQETELRLCLVLAGLPEPECNVILGGPPEPIGRFDLVLQALRTAGYAGPDPVLTDEWRRLFSPSARKLRLLHAFDSS